MKNFVFDLYGTLADIRTDEQSAEFKSAFLNEFGSYFAKGDFFAQYSYYLANETMKDPDIEPDVRNVFRNVANENGYQLSDGEIDHIAKRFRELSRSKLEVYPKVMDMLKELHENGANLYILSNAQNCFTMDEVVSLGLFDAVNGVELSSDFGYKKPSKHFFDHIIEKYSLNSAETVYTGNDIEADVIGSKRAGMTSVYIKTDISPKDDSIEKAKPIANYTVKDHTELKKLLLSLLLDDNA